MPQAIPVVAAWITAAGAAVGITVAATTATLLATAFVYTAGMYLLNKAIAALSPKPPQARGINWNANYSGTSEPRRIIYGQVTVGGMQTIPGICTGNDGKQLHFVITVAGHEVTAISDVYFDEVKIASANIGAVTGTDDDGKVSSGKYKGRAWIRRYLGTPTQTVDHILQDAYPYAFTSDFRGRGIAYLAIQLRYGQKVFATGVPNVTATVQGKKCYDPRSGLTVYTTNPAIIVRDFLIEEVGFSADEIDDSLVTAAANICDQTVAIPGGSEPRYSCNILLIASEGWEDNLRLLIDTMRGRCMYRDGKWRIYAGAWDAASVTINQADWVSPIQVQASLGRDERWNAVRVWYVDAKREGQRVECYPRRKAAYEAQDNNERIWLELEIPGVNGEYQAQRHGEFALRASRNQLKITGRLRPEFVKLAVWDTVYVTDDEFGWTLKTFRVLSMDVSPDGSVDVGLVEEGSATWTDLLAGDYNNEASTTLIDPSGGAEGPVIVDPLFNEGFAWWTNSPVVGVGSLDWEEGFGVTSMDGALVWRPKATGYPVSDFSSRDFFFETISVRTPFFKFVDSVDWTMVLRYRVNSRLAYNVSTPGDDYDPAVAIFGLEAWDNERTAYSNPFASGQLSWSETQSATLGTWYEKRVTVQPANLPVHKVGNSDMKRFLRGRLILPFGYTPVSPITEQPFYPSWYFSSGELEIDVLDAWRGGGGGGVTFASTTDVRSATGAGRAIDPEVAGRELDRLYVRGQHYAAKATAMCDLGNVSGTITVDCSSSNVFRLRLVGNITLATTNQLDGQFVNLNIKQNGAGGKTITYPAYIVVPSGQAIATGPDKRSRIGMQWDAVDSQWDAGIQRGW